jgi:hypothetical protein
MLILMLSIDMLLYLLPRDIPFIDESFFLLASQNKCCATRVRNFMLRDRYDHFLLHHHIVYSPKVTEEPILGVSMEPYK